MMSSMRVVDDKGKPAWLGALPESLQAQHKELLEFLEKNGLGNQLDPIETLLRLSIELVVEKTDQALLPGVTSRMGGEPDLPPGQTWPTWESMPLSFIAQIVITDEIKGLLSFFGHLGVPRCGQGCTVLYFPSVDDFVRTAAPGPRLLLKHAGLISVRGRLVLPSGHAPFIERFNLNSDERDAYHNAVFLELVPPSPNHRLLGWPTAATYNDEKERLFLAQFDSDDDLELEMGDVETFRIYVDGDVVNAATLATAVSTMDEV
jgi:hypothetical protein